MGCWDKYCYPFGYRNNGTFCFNGKFKSFLKEGELCTYSFECKSSFCFNGKCVARLETLLVNSPQFLKLGEENQEGNSGGVIDNTEDTNSFPKEKGFWQRLFEF
jgi:hypothetical protein